MYSYTKTTVKSHIQFFSRNNSNSQKDKHRFWVKNLISHTDDANLQSKQKFSYVDLRFVDVPCEKALSTSKKNICNDIYRIPNGNESASRYGCGSGLCAGDGIARIVPRKIRNFSSGNSVSKVKCHSSLKSFSWYFFGNRNILAKEYC